MNPDREALREIYLQSVIAIELASGLSRQGFMEDLRTQLALRHQIIVIGETVKRLSDAFRDAYPEIPWNQIAGMRDRLVHNHDNIDLEIVWDVVESGIQELMDFLPPILTIYDE